MTKVLAAVLTLVALGAWAMGLQAAGSLSSDVKSLPLPKVVMRPLPELKSGPAIAVAAPAPAPAKAPEPAPEPAPVAAKPEPAKPEVAAKAEPAPAPAPAKIDVAEKPKPEPAKPVAMAKEPAAPKPAPKPQPSSDDSPPPPKPAPALKPQSSDEGGSPSPAPSAPAGEGSINLKASDTAEVVVDGRKVGPSPKLGLKLKSGKHKIRFDCYDENGNLKPGKVQTVEIKPDEEANIDYECPFTQ